MVASERLPVEGCVMFDVLALAALVLATMMMKNRFWLLNIATDPTEVNWRTISGLFAFAAYVPDTGLFKDDLCCACVIWC